MTQPEPEPSPQGPRYQGRLLPHPAEEVVDQGLRFDVGTLTARRMSRRSMLGAFGLGAGAWALAACTTGTTEPTSATAGTGGGSGSASTATDLVEIPDETAGPYPGDGSNGPDVLEESGIIRSDIRSSFGTSSTTAQGVPLEFSLSVLDMAGGGVPFVGVAVYAWQCDAAGRYSMYSEGVEEENYLRGVQITDDDGRVTFTSIVPACYTGRWPHIHVEVYPDADAISDSTNAISTSQLALPKNICDAVYATAGYERSVTNLAGVTLATDDVFGDDGGIHQIASVTGSLDAGYVAALTVPIDTATEPTAGPTGASMGPGGGETPPSESGGETPPEGPGGETPPDGPAGPDGQGGPPDRQG